MYGPSNDPGPQMMQQVEEVAQARCTVCEHFKSADFTTVKKIGSRGLHVATSVGRKYKNREKGN